MAVVTNTWFFKKRYAKDYRTGTGFFNYLPPIEKIYSYGFSFSNVDLPYIKEVCNQLDTINITWFLYDYDEKEVRDRYRKIIRECGFKGEFEVFSVNKQDVNLK